MAVAIECPICEATFLVKQVGPKIGIRCPDCHRKFRYTEDVLADTGGDAIAAQPGNIASASLADRESLTNLAASDIHGDPDAIVTQTQLGTVSPPGVELSDSDVSSESADQSADKPSAAVTQIRLSYQQRHLKQKQIAAGLGIVLLIAIGVLSVVLYRQLRAQQVSHSDETTEGGSSSSAATLQSTAGAQRVDSAAQSLAPVADSGSQVQLVDPPDQDWSGDEPLDAPELPRIAADQLPPRKFQYFKQGELDRIWRKIRPRLISLDVRTDQGYLPSVGTIVDSRGWVATSFQQAGRWPEVRVTASAIDVDAHYEHLDAIADKQTAGQKLLIDQSKGLVEQSSNLDLALLAVNLRFVVSLDALELLPRTRIVPGLFLAQTAPPSADNPYGVEEIEVLAKQTITEFEAVAKSKALNLDLKNSAMEWIVTTKKGQPLPGTPAVDLNGLFAARYVFSTSNYSYFLPADEIASAIVRAQDADPSNPKRPSAISGELLPADHPMARIDELMNRMGSRCEQFGWLATNPQQYVDLQKFLRRLSTLRQFIRDHQDDDSEAVVLSLISNHIDRWQKSISQSISSSNTTLQQAMVTVDDFAIQQLSRRRLTEGGSYIPFFAKVYSVGLDSENLDSVLLEIGQQRSLVQVPFDDRSQRLRPGSQWLCLFKRSKQLASKSIKLDSDEIVPLYTGELLLVLGPIKK